MVGHQQSSTSSSSSSGDESAEPTRHMKRHLKLIDLYKEHECLWNQCSVDFFNFAKKEKIWEQIAEDMKPDSDPEHWKHVIHKLRYNVELERLNELGAKFSHIPRDEMPPKLYYADKFQFLNHMFDFKSGAREQLTLSTPDLSDASTSSTPTESLTARLMRLGRNQNRLPYMTRLKELETLRNSGASMFSLTPETYRKLQVATSGIKSAQTRTKTRNAKKSARAKRHVTICLG